MIITFLRHAHSVWNEEVEDRVDEHNTDANPSRFIDCALSVRGQSQARSLSGHWRTILISPLRRAQQTLELSLLTYEQLIQCDLVREHRVDPCDWLQSEVGAGLLSLESDSELMDRGDRFLEYLSSHLRSGAFHTPLLVISHAEFIHSLTGTTPFNIQYVQLTLPVKMNNHYQSIPELSTISRVTHLNTALNIQRESLQNNISGHEQKMNDLPRAVEWLHESIELRLTEMTRSGQTSATLHTFRFKYRFPIPDGTPSADSDRITELFEEPEVWNDVVKKYYNSPGHDTPRVCLLRGGETVLLSVDAESPVYAWWRSSWLNYHGTYHRMWRWIQTFLC